MVAGFSRWFRSLQPNRHLNTFKVFTAGTLRRLYTPSRAIAAPAIPAFGFSLFGKVEEKKPEMTEVDKVSEALKTADEHYNAVPTRFQEVYDTLIPFKHLETNCEVMWQLARASRDIAQLSGVTEERKKTLIFEGFEFAKKALAADASNWAANKWMGIMTSDVNKYLGTKQTIENAFTIRDYFTKATELKPDDATSWFLLGEWCYNVANLGWMQRKAAAAFFATPPQSSFEEAIKYYLKAEEVKPLFYVGNLVSLGKSYLALKDKPKAKEWFTKASEHPSENEKDDKLIKEAKDHLKSL